MAKAKLISLFLVLALASAFILFFSKGFYQKKQDPNASSTSAQLSSQVEWETGSSTNIDSASIPGSLEIDVATGGYADFISSSYDGNDFIGDLGSSKTITEATIWDSNVGWPVSYSVNGVDWTLAFATAGTGCVDGGDGYATSGTARYVKFTKETEFAWCHNPPVLVEVSNATATHTSASTQIDGSEGGTKNFIEWETFTPTYSEPANTNVKFRFRTSADASNWTSWTDYQTPASGGAFDISGLVDSASGANKYLQVETTLENTDGASTPTVDSYSTGYHTNLAPSTPTNLTAVVGE